MKKEAVYIFISHSHRDVDRVRPIRNYLESIGAEPILFFLKSKTDVDEIEQLIKEEIDARVWFIYCRSHNAESSNWVKKEREYVTLKGKRNITIDLDTAIDSNGRLTSSAKEQLNRIVGNFLSLQKLFISYSHKDLNIAVLIRQRLKYYGVDTFCDLDLGTFRLDLEKSIHREIAESHFYLLLLSSNSIDSNYVRAEFNIARQYNKQIIPVILFYDNESKRRIINNDTYRELLANISCFFFNCSSDESINLSINYLISMLIEILIGE